MKKASIILSIVFVLACAGQNINTNLTSDTPSKKTQQTTKNNHQKKNTRKTNQSMLFKNIDDAYMAMKKDLEKLTDDAVRSAFDIAVEVLKKDPAHIRANIVLFNAHLYKANKEQTVEQFKKLLTLQPKTSESCIDLGTLLARLGKIPEAIIFFEKSVEIDPDFVEGYYNLGRAYSINRQFDQAINAYQKNIEMNPKHYRAWNNLGWIYMIRKDFEKGSEHFNKAIEIKQDYSVAHLNLGTIYLLEEKYDLAEKKFKTYIELKPDNPDGYKNLTTVYQKKQQFDDAIVMFRKLLKLKPDDYLTMNNLAVLLLSKARYGESVKLLKCVYNASIKNDSFKKEVKKTLAVATFHLAETLATHADKKDQALIAYADYLKYADNLSETAIKQVKDKIAALQSVH
jgi:Flp pilus assembly protein TadD